MCSEFRAGLLLVSTRSFATELARKCTALSSCCLLCAGGMVEFRRSLAASFLFRFFLLSSYKLAADAETFKPAFPETYKSAVKVRI